MSEGGSAAVAQALWESAATPQEPRGCSMSSAAQLRGLRSKAEGGSAGSKARKRTLWQQESGEGRVSKWTSSSLDLPSNRKRVEVGWGVGK